MQLCLMSNNMCSLVVYLYICNFLFPSYFYSHFSYPPNFTCPFPLPSFSPSFSPLSASPPPPPFPYTSLSRRRPPLLLLLRYSCTVQAVAASTLFLQFFLFTLWPSKPLHLCVCLRVASANTVWWFSMRPFYGIGVVIPNSQHGRPDYLSLWQLVWNLPGIVAPPAARLLPALTSVFTDAIKICLQQFGGYFMLKDH